MANGENGQSSARHVNGDVRGGQIRARVVVVARRGSVLQDLTAPPEPADTSVRATLRLPEGATTPPTLWLSYERKGSNLQWEADWPADGIVRWRALKPVEHELGVSVEGYATWSTQVDVPEGEVLDLGTIEFAAGRSVRGRVVDSTGKPLVGVDVETGSEFTASFRLTKTDGSLPEGSRCGRASRR